MREPCLRMDRPLFQNRGHVSLRVLPERSWQRCQREALRGGAQGVPEDRIGADRSS